MNNPTYLAFHTATFGFKTSPSVRNKQELSKTIIIFADDIVIRGARDLHLNISTPLPQTHLNLPNV